MYNHSCTAAAWALQLLTSLYFRNTICNIQDTLIQTCYLATSNTWCMTKLEVTARVLAFILHTVDSMEENRHIHLQPTVPMLGVAEQQVCMSVSCMLHMFLKYRVHYTSKIIVTVPMQRCNYYVSVKQSILLML